MADTIPDILVTTGEWLDVYTESNIPVGSAISIYNKGSTVILKQESATQPAANNTDGIPITPAVDETPSLDVPVGAGKIWLRALNRNCDVHVEEGAAYLGEVSVESQGLFENLAEPRIRTSSASMAEMASMSGYRFDVTIDEEFGANEIKYFLFDMPLDTEGIAVILQNRTIQTSKSIAYYDILWDSTGYAPGSTIPSFNENKRSSNTPKMVVFRLDDGTNPVAEGTIRESGFAGSDGGGATGTGAINPGLGVRVYDDSFFIIKVTNGSTAQRVKVAYEWYEVPLEMFTFI